MLEKGLFAFSADPITYGHIDIIIKASKTVRVLYVAIACNPQKKYFLSFEERKYLVEKIFSHYPNIKIIGHLGLIVNLLLKENITHYFRGIRNKQDKQYEQTTALYNQNYFPNLKTIYIKSHKSYRHISSTAVKKLTRFTQEISNYVPSIVKKHLEQKSEILQVAITGSIASGKTTLCKFLKQNLQNYLQKSISNIDKKKIFFDIEKLISNTHYIDFDELVKQIYLDLEKEKLPALEMELIKTFKKNILNEEGRISLVSIKNYFSVSNNSNLKKTKLKFLKLQNILFPFIMMSYREAIKNKKGLILLEVSMLAEYSLASVFNGDIIVVALNEKEQINRLMTRDNINQAEARDKILLANSTDHKIESLQNQAIRNEIPYTNFFNLAVYQSESFDEQETLSFFKDFFLKL